jgi:acetate---CoA ligase (ADP-forming)
VLPDFASLDNPIDITAMVLRDVSLWPRTAQALLDDPGIGSLCLPMVAGSSNYAMDKVHALLPTLGAHRKPAVIVLLGDDAPVPPEFLTGFRAKNIPVLRSPERALRALAHATEYGKRIMAPEFVAQAISAPELPRSGILPEYESKACFAALGIAVPKGALARDANEAKAIAAHVGYPIVLKAQAAALAHKSDVGGVALNVANAEALEAAWQRVTANIAAKQPDLKLAGMLVEEMARPGLELIIGAKRDAEWGPVLMAGLGGIWTEALGDVRLMPADISQDEIMAELYRLKGARVLDGLRGAPAVDVRGIAETVMRLGALMRARPEIREIDINPLVAYPDRVLALDALIVVD